MMRRRLTTLLVALVLMFPGSALATHGNTVTNKGPTCNATDADGGFDSENEPDYFATYTAADALLDTPYADAPAPYFGYPDTAYSCWASRISSAHNPDEIAYGGRGILNFTDTTGPDVGAELFVQAAFYIPEGTADSLDAQLSLIRWDAYGHNGCDDNNLPANGIFINQSDGHLILATEYDSNLTADPNPCNGVKQNVTEVQDEILDYGDADPLEDRWFHLFIRQQFGTAAGSSGADGPTCSDPSSPYHNEGGCQYIQLDAVNSTTLDWNSSVSYAANIKGEDATNEYHDRLRAGVVAAGSTENSDIHVYLDQVKVTNYGP